MELFIKENLGMARKRGLGKKKQKIINIKAFFSKINSMDLEN